MRPGAGALWFLFLTVAFGAAPKLTVKDSNEVFQVPTKGGLLSKISGTGFTKKSVAFVGATKCTKTLYKSPTLLTCVVPPGVGADLSVIVKDSGKTAEATEQFSYAEPAPMGVNPLRGSLRGERLIVITGSNFGTTKQKVKITLAGKDCLAVKWVDDQTVHCVTPEVEKPGKEVLAVFVAKQKGLMANAYNYVVKPPLAPVDVTKLSKLANRISAMAKEAGRDAKFIKTHLKLISKFPLSLADLKKAGLKPDDANAAMLAHGLLNNLRDKELIPTSGPAPPPGAADEGEVLGPVIRWYNSLFDERGDRHEPAPEDEQGYTKDQSWATRWNMDHQSLVAITVICLLFVLTSALCLSSLAPRVSAWRTQRGYQALSKEPLGYAREPVYAFREYRGQHVYAQPTVYAQHTVYAQQPAPDLQPPKQRPLSSHVVYV